MKMKVSQAHKSCNGNAALPLGGEHEQALTHSQCWVDLVSGVWGNHSLFSALLKEHSSAHLCSPRAPKSPIQILSKQEPLKQTRLLSTVRCCSGKWPKLEGGGEGRRGRGDNAHAGRGAKVALGHRSSEDGMAYPSQQDTLSWSSLALPGPLPFHKHPGLLMGWKEGKVSSGTIHTHVYTHNMHVHT